MFLAARLFGCLALQIATLPPEIFEFNVDAFNGLNHTDLNGFVGIETSPFVRHGKFSVAGQNPSAFV